MGYIALSLVMFVKVMSNFVKVVKIVYTTNLFFFIAKIKKYQLSNINLHYFNTYFSYQD